MHTAMLKNKHDRYIVQESSKALAWTENDWS